MAHQSIYDTHVQSDGIYIHRLQRDNRKSRNHSDRDVFVCSLRLLNHKTWKHHLNVQHDTQGTSLPVKTQPHKDPLTILYKISGLWVVSYFNTSEMCISAEMESSGSTIVGWKLVKTKGNVK